MAGVVPVLVAPHANSELEYPSAIISWRAPGGCPSEASVARRIDALLGGSLAAERAQRLAFRAVVDADDSGRYRVRLEVSGGGGTYERLLSHGDCEQLAEATSLVVALAIDSARVERERPSAAGVATGSVLLPSTTGAAPPKGPEPVRPPPPASGPAPTSAAAPASASAPTSPASASAPTSAAASSVSTPARLNEASRKVALNAPSTPDAHSGAPSRWGVALGATGELGSGQLPEPSFGFGLGASAIFERSWWVTVFAQTWLPSRVDVEGTAGEVEFDLTTVGARGCFARSAGRITPMVCFGAELGILEGTASGLSSNRTRQDRWSGLHGEVGALLSVYSWLDVALSGTLGLALERPRFGVLNATGEEVEVFQPRAWYARVSLGLQFRFD